MILKKLTNLTFLSSKGHRNSS